MFANVPSGVLLQIFRYSSQLDPNIYRYLLQYSHEQHSALLIRYMYLEPPDLPWCCHCLPCLSLRKCICPRLTPARPPAVDCLLWSWTWKGPEVRCWTTRWSEGPACQWQCKASGTGLRQCSHTVGPGQPRYQVGLYNRKPKSTGRNLTGEANRAHECTTQSNK